jgi:putative membrane protein
MQRVLLHWALSGLAIWIVSRIVPGFVVTDAVTALIAALVIGFVNATVGFILKVITLPLSIMTLGLFWFIINGLMIEVAANFIPGFAVQNFASAFWGAIVLSLVNVVLKVLLLPTEL